MNSKRKGNRYELKTAKLLTKITGVKWYRTISSGAYATTQATTDTRFAGDIYTDNKRYKNIIIECKATKHRITLEDLFNPKAKIWNWIQQAQSEAKNKDWILIFKANNGKDFALTTQDNITELASKIFKKDKNNIIFLKKYKIVRI